MSLAVMHTSVTGARDGLLLVFPTSKHHAWASVQELCYAVRITHLNTRKAHNNGASAELARLLLQLQAHRHTSYTILLIAQRKCAVLGFPRCIFSLLKRIPKPCPTVRGTLYSYVPKAKFTLE